MRNETRPEFPPQPLEEAFLGKPTKRLRGIEPKPSDSSVRVDLETIRRRISLLENVEQRFREKPLAERLRLVNGESADTVDVLRQGLLGFLPDETLISDIAPQGEGNMPSDKLNQDPLWADISDRLEYHQVSMVVSVFKAINRASEKLLDEKRAAPVKNALGVDKLQTLGDLRSVSHTSLEKLPGLGEKSASVLFEAIKKIEE